MANPWDGKDDDQPFNTDHVILLKFEMIVTNVVCSFVIGYLTQQYVLRCRFIDDNSWRTIALLDPVMLIKLYSSTKPVNQYGARHLMSRYIYIEVIGCCLQRSRIANSLLVYSSPQMKWTESLSHSTTPPLPKNTESLLEERNISSVGSMSPLLRFPFSSVPRYAWMNTEPSCFGQRQDYG